MSQYDNRFEACVDQSKVFFAKIVNRETGENLDPTEVTSIVYNVYPLGIIDGQRKEAIPGHRRVSVPLTTLTATIESCPVFTPGYNFRYAPDCRTRPLFPRAGKFEVAFILTLATGNPILLSYRFNVE